MAGVDDLVRLLDGDRIGEETDFLIFSVQGKIEIRTVVPTGRPATQT